MECVDSLFEGNQGVRVLVVDNGSTDGSVSILKERYPELEIIENDENLGYVKGANQGVRRALELGASHILLINNDAIARPRMLERLMAAMEEHPQAGVVGPKIFYYGTDVMWFNGGHFNHLLGLSTHPLMDRLDDGGDQDREVEFITGCAMLVRPRSLGRSGSSTRTSRSTPRTWTSVSGPRTTGTAFGWYQGRWPSTRCPCPRGSRGPI